jgi:hypothetical protein
MSLLNDYIRDGARRVTVTGRTTSAELNAAIRRARDGESVAEPAEPDAETQAGSGSADGGRGNAIAEHLPARRTFSDAIRDLRGL